jgi:Tol biopolymer transport system component
VVGNATSRVAFSVVCPAVAVGNRIAFSSYRDGNWEIYLMESDGSNPVNLTNHPGYDELPDWSSDGTRIAFFSSRDSVAGIYVMDADGSNVRLVIEDGWRSSWSPRGDRIAFEHVWGDIYTVNLDGSNLVPLFDSPTLSQSEPAWSPDGQWIAFSGFDGNEADIYVVGANGGVPINLTLDGYSDDEPAWSPDGKRIAFTSYKNWQPGVYVMDADGSNVRQVVSGACIGSPTWSPDGARIAYSGLCSSGYEILSVRVDGTDLVQLTDTSGTDEEPDWSPIP